MKETPELFLLNCKEYDMEQAKLEKDIKGIFYKNNCHKLNTTTDDLFGECDLPSEDAVIGRKKMQEFILATGKEIENQNKNAMIKFFLLKFFIYVFFYFFILFYFYFSSV